MVAILSSIIWTSGLLGGIPGAEACAGYLYRPAYCIDEILRPPGESYDPQPGDLMLCTEFHRVFWNVTFKIALAGHPYHSGIIFRHPDGCLALLEAGPHDTFFIELLELVPHMKSYEELGPVWIRQRKVPLTCEESDRLTAFALAQDKKRFALVRLGAQLTPFRSRGPLRTYVVGRPKGIDRRTFFCAELVMEACVYAGLLDAKTTRPAATYPRDFFFDRSVNLYNNKHLNLSPCWYPPARWTSCLPPGIIEQQR